MHKPVMLEESYKFLKPKLDGVLIDLTGGDGGHSHVLSRKINSHGRLIVLDRDPEAVGRLKERFKGKTNITVVHSNFKDFDNVLENLGIDRVDGMIGDFGVSTRQLTEGARGFSFRKEGPLDMRMNPDDVTKAYDVVNGYSRETLTNILKKFGEEKFAWKIAGEITRARAIKKIDTTLELADIIAKAVPAKFHKKGIHPATQAFQAIRIFVNGELEAIETMLGKLEKYINVGARCAFISFHSLEDRLVKEYFRRYAAECVCPPSIPVCVCGKKQTFRIITKKPITPSMDEVEKNPLSRSAKLRVAERI